jgi:hypothetical protein
MLLSCSYFGAVIMMLPCILYACYLCACKAGESGMKVSRLIESVAILVDISGYIFDYG